MPSTEVLPSPATEDGATRIALFDPAAQPATPALDSDFEIGHVLFVDLVGYTKLLLDEQSEQLKQLNVLVRSGRQFQRAENEGSLIRLPTGDGMALVFRHSPEEPAICALEIASAVRSQPQLQLRMGIHSGPVNHLADVNGRVNVAGAGINIAQRVMDCGDAGHILVSKHVAEDLEHSARWRPHLHPLGSYEVKHGDVISVVNLCTGELGNSQTPAKLVHDEQIKAIPAVPRSTLPYTLTLAGLLAAAAFVAGQEYFSRTRPVATSILPTNPAPVAAALPNVPAKSIAVLPFDNLSANPESAFFTDGVQDEILTNLAKVADLKVISRTSVMQYRNQAHRNLREIGRQLGVAFIVEGSVQRQGERVRINAQCIDARSDAHVWAQTYDRDLADVFAIQSEIARSIATQLQAHFSPNEQAEIDRQPTADMPAYDLYLRALQIDRARTSSVGSGGLDGARQEIQLLEEALGRDPNFVAALTLFAHVNLYLFWMNADDPQAHLAAAKTALERAARFQPDSGGVHLTRALLLYWGSRAYDDALAELELAHRAMPNDARPLFFTALIERRRGDWVESTRHMEQVRALDPFNIAFISELAGINYPALRRYADANKLLDGALAVHPKDFGLASIRANIDFAANADLRRWEELLGTQASSPESNDVANARIDLAMRQRDYARADHLLGQNLGGEVDDNGYFTPREWKQAIAARGLRDETRARAFLDVAHERAAAAAKTRPDDAKALIVLAEIEAALGNKEAALQTAERATQLLPLEKDAINGLQILLRFAQIHLQLGEREAALQLLDRVAQLPNGPTYGALKLEEAWDALRGDARFERLVATLAPAVTR